MQAHANLIEARSFMNGPTSFWGGVFGNDIGGDHAISLSVIHLHCVGAGILFQVVTAAPLVAVTGGADPRSCAWRTFFAVGPSRTYRFTFDTINE